ncbi:MAG: WG repeat-containing protein [Eubacteriales bacterium]|nr:WG repeat-containing protein [Eubacteriales bacterium]
MASKGNGSNPILAAYFILVALVVAGVTIFALLYSGQGAAALNNASAAFNEAVQEERGLDIQTTPAPTPTPVPVSLAGRIIPYYDTGIWGYKNTAGQIVIQPAFTEAYEFENGVAFAKKDGVFGLLSVNDVWLVEPVWTSVQPFSDDYAAVEKDGKWGYIDRSGKTVIDYTFREAGSFHCGRAAVRSGSAFGYIDIFGNMAVSAKWRKAGDFAEDLAFATSNEYEKDRHYIIDKVGEKVATLGSTIQGTVFSEGFAVVVERGSTYYYLNSVGQSAYKQTFRDARAFSEGLAAVQNEDGWGFINTLGSFEIPAQYAQVQDFSDGYAAVLDKASGKWGYIDQKGEGKIEALYDSAEPFQEGFAIVSIGSEFYLLDQKGESKLFYTK